MKFKYYLKGVGCGILVATIILAVSNFLHDDSLTREEIIAEAQKMGMVWPGTVEDTEKGPLGNTQDSTNTEGTADTETAAVPDTQGTSETENTTETNPPAPVEQGSLVTLTIEPGEYTRAVSEKLFALGLVDDAESFRVYVGNVGQGNNILMGTFQIPMGATYDEIITILTTEQSEGES